jgi:hypothetical protein
MLMAAFAGGPNGAITEVVYLAPTKLRAKELIWNGPDGLLAMLKLYHLEDLVEVNHTSLVMVVKANGCIIHVGGASTEVDADAYLGHKFILVVIDEAQSINEKVLNHLIFEVLNPTRVDHNGRIIISGTPKRLCAGLFYEADQNPKVTMWVRKKWTLFQNPFMPNAQEWLTKELNDTGQKVDDPDVLRMYFGIWVREASAQLYQYMPINDFSGQLPIRDQYNKGITWNYTLGMDLGSVDLTTFIVVAWSRQVPQCFVVECFGKDHLTDLEIANIVKRYMIHYPNLKLVMDAGAQGLRAKENFLSIYGLNFEAADKHEKAATIRELNTSLRNGNVLLAPTCQPLKDQLTKIEIDPNTLIEPKSASCDYADAFLYAWRWTHSHAFKPMASPETEQEKWSRLARESENNTRKQYDRHDPLDQIQQEFDAEDKLGMDPLGDLGF